MSEKLIPTLLTLATVCLSYKYFYHLRNSNNKGTFLFGFPWSNYQSHIAVYFPLKYLPNNDEDNKSRKKANIALYIFYCLACMLIVLFQFNGGMKQQFLNSPA